ncbi:hypothetical protein [Cryptosporangium sp. NPDC051539]|uniref:hypothetical protein n=1 Tax=Cryptosporangium sp. NPDC051539 TaxID=3363962 RepID=UPI0037BDC6D0
MTDLGDREFFAQLGARPGMYVGRPSFAAVSAFLLGYDQHAARHGEPALAGWSEWLNARRGKECNHAWPGVVLHLAFPDGWARDLPPDDDAHAVAVLFGLLDEFLAQREC